MPVAAFCYATGPESGVKCHSGLSPGIIQQSHTFCCNRRFTAATGLRPARLTPRTLNVLHEYASGPPGSARRSRHVTRRFHDEPS
jgi:hypothetical protein